MIGPGGRGTPVGKGAESKQQGGTPVRGRDRGTILDSGRAIDVGEGMAYARRSERISGLYTQGVYLSTPVVIRSAGWVALAHADDVDEDLQLCVAGCLEAFRRHTGQRPDEVAIGWSPAALLRGMEEDRRSYLEHEPARALRSFFENWADDADPAELFASVPGPHDGRGTEAQWAAAKEAVLQRMRATAFGAMDQHGLGRAVVFEVPDGATVMVTLQGEVALLPEDSPTTGEVAPSAESTASGAADASERELAIAAVLASGSLATTDGKWAAARSRDSASSSSSSSSTAAAAGPTAPVFPEPPLRTREASGQPPAKAPRTE